MTLRVILVPAAQADVAQAIHWYESKRPGLSFDFRLSLDATFDRIAIYPESSPAVANGIRRALLHRFPYAVYYRLTTSVIEIVAILDLHRHPRIWQRRSQ